MAKKKRRHSAGLSGTSLNGSTLKDYAVKGLCLVGGLAIGSVVNKFVGKKDSVSGTDLLGLDGNTSKVTTPLITIGLGLASTLLVKEQHLKMVGLGIGAAGGVTLANNFLGENKISLSGDDEEATPLPGVGAIENFNQLPTNYDLEKTYHDIPDDVNADVDVVGDTDVEFEEVDGVDLM